MLCGFACSLFLESFEMLATCASLLLRPFKRFVLFAIVTAISISQFLLLCDVDLII